MDNSNVLREDESGLRVSERTNTVAEEEHILLIDEFLTNSKVEDRLHWFFVNKLDGNYHNPAAIELASETITRFKEIILEEGLDKDKYESPQQLLYGIAWNVLYEHYRSEKTYWKLISRLKAKANPQEDGLMPSPEAEYLQQEKLERQIELANIGIQQLAKINPRNYQILYLFYVEELSPEEIITRMELDITIKTVRNLISTEIPTRIYQLALRYESLQ